MSESPNNFTEDQLKEEASKELAPVIDMSLKVQELEQSLSANPQFIEFMQLRDAVSKKEAEVKKNIEQRMIENSIKKVVIDTYGTFTIVDGKTWSYDEDELPRKFIKKAVDTTAVNNHYKLTGKLPKGATYVPKQFLKVTPKKDKKA